MKIEKEEKRLAAIVAGEAVEDALNYFGTFDKLHAQGLITAENRQRIFLTAFQWAERGIAAYEGMTALQRAETDGRVAFVELYQKRAALAVGLAQWLPSWPIEEAGRALSQRMLEARKGAAVDLPALDQDLKAHLVQVDRAVEEIQPYIRAASEGIEKLGKQAYLKAYPSLLGVLKPAMLALTKLRMKAFDLHKEQIWTLAHRLVVEKGMDGLEIMRESLALLNCAVDLSDRDAIDLLQDARIPLQESLASRVENGAVLLREHAEAFIGLASRYFDAEAGASQPGILEFARQLVVAIGALARQCDAVLEAPKVS